MEDGIKFHGTKIQLVSNDAIRVKVEKFRRLHEFISIFYINARRIFYRENKIYIERIYIYSSRIYIENRLVSKFHFNSCDSTRRKEKLCVNQRETLYTFNLALIFNGEVL